MNLESLLARSLVVAAVACVLGGCGEPEAEAPPCDPTTAAGCADVQADTGIGFCADTAGEDTAPFCLLTSWGNGSVAPDGHWRAEVHIGPRPTGLVVLTTGYGSTTYAREFELSEEVLPELRGVYASIDLEGAEVQEEYPIGGGPVGLAVVVDGASTTYGAWLEDPWEGRKQQLARRAAALVPDSLWAELRAVTGLPIRPVGWRPEG